MQRVFWLMLSLLIAGCSGPSPAPRSAASDADATFTQLADEYLTGYLAWRPQTGTALGFHEYDGKITDFSQASLDAELARLKAIEQRLGQLNTNRLSRQAFYDYRILGRHSAGDLRLQYVTPVEPDWPPQQKEEWLTAFNYYTTDIVSIHEAYPGHYVQFLCLKASPDTRLESAPIVLTACNLIASREAYTLQEKYGSDCSQIPPARSG